MADIMGDITAMAGTGEVEGMEVEVGVKKTWERR